MNANDPPKQADAGSPSRPQSLATTADATCFCWFGGKPGPGHERGCPNYEPGPDSPPNTTREAHKEKRTA